MRNIYQGYESEIRRAHGKKDQVERIALKKELAAAIRRHLDEVKFWDTDPNDREAYIAKLTTRQVGDLYPSIHLLVRSLVEAKKGGSWRYMSRVMWPGRIEPEGINRLLHSFTLWYARLGRRLGSRTCLKLGVSMCQKAGFTLKKGREILAALEPRFRAIHEAEERAKTRRYRGMMETE